MIFLELFWTFFKIGLFTFGGGYAMLPLIQEQVITHSWLTEEAIVNFIAVSESTPGPFAINIATYVGSQVGSAAYDGNFWFAILGSFFATLGVVLPSFIVILLVARFYQQFKSSHTVKGLMTGLKPAAIGLIASAVISMAATVFIPNGFSTAMFKSVELYISAAIFALCVFLVFYKRKKIPPVLIICIAAVLGIATGYAFNL
ncbi:MAG: chromate transporter [Clostridia bacterium]|nr:chromate transporter [Clostridia bacterium]